LDIERRLLQMARPLSVILQLFPNGKERFEIYLNKRQDEIRRTRSESWEGSLFNTTLSLAIGEENEDQDIPNVITAKMIADLSGKTTTLITRVLHNIGFETDLDRIPVIGRDGVVKKKTARKLVVPSLKKWNEIISRYYYSEDHTIPVCPENLKGKHWVDREDKTHFYDKFTTTATGSVTD
jgi:hypothetical protein